MEIYRLKTCHELHRMRPFQGYYAGNLTLNGLQIYCTNGLESEEPLVLAYRKKSHLYQKQSWVGGIELGSFLQAEKGS
jgi:hypothetical protein